MAVRLTLDVNINIPALFGVIERLDRIMATQAEHAAELRAIKEQNDKAHDEIVARIAALEAALANAGNTSDEVNAALADLKASVQRDDDMNPDAPQA